MGNYYAGMMNASVGDSLAHYGILGQKWGVRRFQNLDRTWTAAGKERYGRKGSGRRRKSDDVSDNAKYAGKTAASPSAPHDKKGHLDNEMISMLATSVTSVGSLVAVSGITAAEYGVPFGVAFKAVLAANPHLALGAGLIAGYGAVRAGMAVKAKYDNKKYEAERENNPIDKKTGFHKKTEKMEERDDLKRVNPEHNNFNQNTKSNCALCSATYELRRRGYDVRANKEAVGYTTDEFMKWFPGAKINHVKPSSEKQNQSEYLDDAVKDIEKNNKNGARGALFIQFRDVYGRFVGGHACNYDIVDGKMRILDGQTGKIYTDASEALKDMGVGDVRYARLDNVAFNVKNIKEACN